MSTHTASFVPRGPFKVPSAMPTGPAFRMSSGELRQPGANGNHGSALRAVKPALAEDVHEALLRERQRADALEATVASFGIAMIALDANGLVCHATPSATALLNGDRGLQLVGGRLVATRNGDDVPLQSLLQRVTNRQVAPSAGPKRISTLENSRRDAAGLDGVRLQGNPPVVPLHVSVMRTSLRPESGETAALVFLHEGRMNLPGRGALLRTLYGVTPTQARLADLLLNGSSVRDAADAMGVAEDTARFHLKSLFRTTGANNQSSLLRLMMSLPGAL